MWRMCLNLPGMIFTWNLLLEFVLSWLCQCLRGMNYGGYSTSRVSLTTILVSDARLLQGLADLAVVALQNAQVYEREKRLVVEGRLLNEISKEITSQLDFARVFD